MFSAAPVVLLRRRVPVLRVVAAIVVVLGVLSMHAISAGAACTPADAASMTPAHASTADRMTSTGHMHGEHTDASAHAASACVVTPSRKAVSHVGTLPAVAITVSALPSGDTCRRRQVARISDCLSMAGGLRR